LGFVTKQDNETVLTKASDHTLDRKGKSLLIRYCH